MEKCHAKVTAVRFWFHPKNASKMRIYLFNDAKYAYEFARMNESSAANLKIVEIVAEDLKARKRKAFLFIQGAYAIGL